MKAVASRRAEQPSDFVQGLTVLTSLGSKVRVFSDIFRHRKTEVFHFISQIYHNYRLLGLIIHAHTINKARLCFKALLERFRT
jgi:hypothetical protein